MRRLVIRQLEGIFLSQFFNELFAGDQCLGKVQLVAVGCGCYSYLIVEALFNLHSCFAGSLGGAALVELLRPQGQVLHVISRGGELAANMVDPEGAVCRLAGGQNGGAVLERDAEHARPALGGQPELIAQGGCPQIARRGGLIVGVR